MGNFFGFFKSFLSGLSSKEKFLFYFAFFVLFLLLLDKIAYSPISSRAQQLRDQISIEKKLIRKNILIIGHKDRILAEKKSHEHFFSQPEITRDRRVAMFLSEVEQIAQESQVERTSTGSVEVEKDTDLFKYRLTIECQGKMSDIIRFIHAIDSSDKPLRVVSLELTPQRRADYTVNSAVTIEKLIIFPVEENILL